MQERIVAKQYAKGLIPAQVEKEETGDGYKPKVDKKGNVELDYNMAMPAMLERFCPMGLLGLGLTALMASFMSGMAGNVTAFNTVWTYDIYQSYIAPGRSDNHYLWMGRMATIFGILVSVATAYMARSFNNIMDMLQLVFGFVNAPLFATFMLGMFWKRATGHGAFFGLLSGTLAAAVHHGISVPHGAETLVKGGWLGWLGVRVEYASEMAQNFWMAIMAWSVCFVHDDRHLPGHAAGEERRGAARVGLVAHAPRGARRRGGLVRTSLAPGGTRAWRHPGTQYPLLVVSTMNLDIRTPIGSFFSIVGVILAGFGLFSDPKIYADHSLGINVNLWWGLLLVVLARGCSRWHGVRRRRRRRAGAEEKGVPSALDEPARDARARRPTVLHRRARDGDRRARGGHAKALL